MYPSSDYTLQKLQDSYYLLPLGQGIATFHRQLKINESLADLYVLICQICNSLGDISRDELLEILITHTMKLHEVPDEEHDSVAEDIDEFLTYLTGYGVLIGSAGNDALPFISQALISNILLKFYGNSDCISNELKDFYVEEVTEHYAKDHTLSVYFHTDMLQNNEKKILLIHTSELIIYRSEYYYILEYPGSTGIRNIHLSLDGLRADFYITGEVDDKLRYDIFHAIRLVLSYQLQNHNQFLIHSASILYQGRVWLFSGPSGTGKSTHTALWNKLYDTPVINGDLNLITLCEMQQMDQPMTYGIPWCGTSEIYSKEKYPLGGIIFLHQDDHNVCESKKEDEKQLSVLQRLISPFWTVDQMEKNLAFTDALIKRIPIWHLRCTKDDDAAICMKEVIDNYLKKNNESIQMEY